MIIKVIDDSDWNNLVVEFFDEGDEYQLVGSYVSSEIEPESNPNYGNQDIYKYKFLNGKEMPISDNMFERLFVSKDFCRGVWKELREAGFQVV
jgi:hypothetical protein